MAHLSDRRAASVRALTQIKDVTEEDAKAIRKAWKTIPNRKEAREAVDKILRTYGVEFLGVDRRTGADVYYCNTGDGYDQTILFRGLTLSVGYWAFLVETNSIREPSNPYR